MELAVTSIELKNITKTFVEAKSKKEICVFTNFSIKLASSDRNKIVSFIGKSGSGKTTLLRLISGLEGPTKGEVFINNLKINTPSRSTTLVPQQFTCFPWLNVFENIAFGLTLNKSPNIKKKVVHIANELGLNERLNAYPRELSGGMKQRVAIGRALAMESPILLLDEPFGSLDAETREDMQQLLLRINETANKLIILVTHDLREAILLSDIVHVLPMPPIPYIKSSIEIPFKRPRDQGLMQSTEFNFMYSNLRSLL